MGTNSSPLRMRQKHLHTIILLAIYLVTNVSHYCYSYMPIAEFIVERENASSVAEALQIIAQWNSDWNPPYFMVDYS